MAGYATLDTELSINGATLATETTSAAVLVQGKAINVVAEVINTRLHDMNTTLSDLNVIAGAINVGVYDMNTTLSDLNVIAGAINVGVYDVNVVAGAINVVLEDINSKVLDYPTMGATFAVNVSGSSAATTGAITAGKYVIGSTVDVCWVQGASPSATWGLDTYLPAGVPVPVTLAAQNIAGETAGGTGTLLATKVS